MSDGARSARAWTVAVGALAAGYFWLGIGLSVEWVDGGQIVYPSWQVARGALPYRDFLQLYGPAEFFFNGALLRFFGANLWVLLVALVLVKATVAALAYAGARAVAPAPFALGATALLVAIWGTPVWVFDTPYANHYSTALILAGTVAVAAASQRRFLAWCAVAGICFGLAATFKQTAGVFACAALGLAVMACSARRAPAAGAAPAAARRDRLVRAVRLLFLAGTTALVVAYLAPADTIMNACVLGAPVAIGIGWLAGGELRDAGDRGARRRGVLALTIVGVGAALPVAASAIYFAHLGAWRELAFDTVDGLPHLIRWFTPVARPPADALLAMLALAAGLPLLVRTQSAAQWTVGAALAGGAVLAIAAIDLHGAGMALVVRVLTLLLFVTAWGGLAAVRADSRRGTAPARREAVAIFAFTGAVALLLLYPAGDPPHVMMAWPFFVPISAHLLWRWYRAAAAGWARRGRIALGLLAGGFVAALCAPFTAMLLQRLADPPPPLRLGRAFGVREVDPRAAEAAPVIDYLAGRPDGPLLVLSGEQMLYFLSGRDSIVAPSEFVLYLVVAGAIRDADAHRLLDDAGFAAQLEAQRPLVVDRSGPAAKRLRGAYPQVAQALDAHYAPVYRTGAYRVLAWKD